MRKHEKMRKILEKMKNHILYCDLIIAILFVIYHVVLYIFHMRFRQWIYYMVPLLLLVGFIIGIVQIVRKKSKKIKMIFLSLGIAGIILLAMSWKIILILFAFTYSPEHVVYKEDKKYVAYVKSFLDVDVYYYNYINLFLVGNQVKLHEWYGNGGYDPFDNKHDNKPLQSDYYDENGKIIKTDDPYANFHQDYKIDETDEKDKIPDLEENNSRKENDILYQKRINDKVIIRVVYKGAVLGQRSIISIEKTVDSGKTWIDQIDNLDGYIQVHNGAEFVFLNEKIGFINDPGLAGTSGDNGSLMVTINGGKSFTASNVTESDKVGKEIFIEGLPYIENDMLKLKVYTFDNKNSKRRYYEFYSEDYGLNWRYE